MILGLAKGDSTGKQALEITNSYTLGSPEADFQMEIHMQEFY